MTKILNILCLVTLLSGLASAQIVPVLLNWNGADSTLTTLPKTLVETGFNKNNPALFKPYTVNVPQWRGFIESNRYINLPAGQKVIAGDSINYTFPVGTVLIRDSYIDLKQGDPTSRVFVETQFQIMKANNEWSRVTYRYKEDGTTAVITENDFYEKTYTVDLNGKYPEFGTPTVNVPYMRTAFECNSTCHTASANGFITQQLNNGTQLAGLVTAGVLAAAPNTAAWEGAGKIARWYSWDSPDPKATPTKKFFSYLAGNCSHCHNTRTDTDTYAIVHFYEYFSKEQVNVFQGDDAIFILNDSAASWAINRIDKLEMPQAEAFIPDKTTINNMVKFIKSEEAKANIHHMAAAGKSNFHATLNSNLLRFSRPGPAKLFDLTGKEIRLNRIDGSTFLVTEVLRPGIYIAKMGSRTSRVSHF